MSDNLTEGPTEHIALIEIPLERGRQFRALVAAAREWRGGLIPATSTSTWTPTRNLLAALAVFDTPCDHPRSWRAFRSQSADADEVCGFCGTTVVGGLTARRPPVNRPLLPVEPESDAPATSSPPDSSSSSP